MSKEKNAAKANGTIYPISGKGDIIMSEEKNAVKKMTPFIQS